MIEKPEVPDFAGIQYVDKANQIKIKKLATYRSMKEIPFYLLQGLAGACGAEINVSDIPVRFLGKELSQQDLQAVISQKVEDLREYEIKEEVRKRIREIESRRSSRDVFIRKVRQIIFKEDESEMMEEALRCCKLGKIFCERYPLKDKIENLKLSLEEIENLIQDSEQLKLKE